MQKREKILLGILIIIAIGFLGQKAFSSLNSSGKSEETLVEYNLENLGQKIKPRKNNESIETEMDILLYDKDFFNKNSKKSVIIALEPVLEEIMEGPGGFAAIISGNFVLAGDNVYNYTVEEITAQKVILNSNGKKKILERE